MSGILVTLRSPPINSLASLSRSAYQAHEVKPACQTPFRHPELDRGGRTQAAPAVPVAPEPIFAGAPPAVALTGAASPDPELAAAALAADARAKKGPRELDTICGSPTSDCK
jgi:hypothetical protein